MVARSGNDELERLTRFKGGRAPAGEALGPAMIEFFKQTQKRQTKLGKIAQCWSALVPEALNNHCALESYTRGSLIVIVDSSSHLYDLKQLLLAGLQKQILLACKSTGLRKITLKAGRWYDGDSPADGKLRFE